LAYVNGYFCHRNEPKSPVRRKGRKKRIDSGAKLIYGGHSRIKIPTKIISTDLPAFRISQVCRQRTRPYRVEAGSFVLMPKG